MGAKVVWIKVSILIMLPSSLQLTFIPSHRIINVIILLTLSIHLPLGSWLFYKKRRYNDIDNQIQEIHLEQRQTYNTDQSNADLANGLFNFTTVSGFFVCLITLNLTDWQDEIVIPAFLGFTASIFMGAFLVPFKILASKEGVRTFLKARFHVSMRSLKLV